VTVHLCASHPDHAQFAELSRLIALAANPHMSGYDVDMPDDELAALRATLRDAMQHMIDHYQYLPDAIAGQVKRAEER
jgi:hypothetical protein